MTLAIWSIVPPLPSGQLRHCDAIDRPEIAVLVRPLVPDLDAALLQPAHIGLAAQEPQQLIDHRFEVDLLGRDQRKALRAGRTASGGRKSSACRCRSGRAGRRRFRARSA